MDQTGGGKNIALSAGHGPAPSLTQFSRLAMYLRYKEFRDPAQISGKFV